MIDLRSDTVTRPTPADAAGDGRRAGRRRRLRRRSERARAGAADRRAARQGRRRLHGQRHDDQPGRAARSHRGRRRGAGRRRRAHRRARARRAGRALRHHHAPAAGPERHLHRRTTCAPRSECRIRFMPATQPPIKLLCVENTHNLGGGTVWPLEAILAVAEVARGRRSRPASGRRAAVERRRRHRHRRGGVCRRRSIRSASASPRAWARRSARPWPARATSSARARRFKALFGGGIRQGGIVAAAALYALEHHRARLAEDHAQGPALGRSAGGAAGDRSSISTRCRPTSCASG